MPLKEEETEEQKARREAWEARRENLPKKRKTKNRAKRIILIKAKYGDDTKKTSLGTSITSASFLCKDFANGQTSANLTVDPCPAGDYVVEYYTEPEGNGDKPTGTLSLNGVKKKEHKARKNGGPNNYFHGLEEITIIEDMKPQTFKISLKKVGGGRAKIQEGTIALYRKYKYIPPIIIPDPSNPVIPPFPIDQGVRRNGTK